MSESSGIVFPTSNGERRTTPVGRAVLERALGAVDPLGASSVSRETRWRSGYPEHFRRAVEAYLLDDSASIRVSEAGLSAIHELMRWVPPTGPTAAETPTSAAFELPSQTLGTTVVHGQAEREREFTLPYRGERLRGDAVKRRLDAWAVRGVLEPSVTEAVCAVIDHPEWLALPGRTAVLLGAGAGLSPMRALLRWGADVAAVDLPDHRRAAIMLQQSAASAGTVRVPMRAEASDGESLDRRVGADLLHNLGAVTSWVTDLDVPGELVVGSYLYADGGVNVRLAVAADLLDQHVLAARPHTAWAGLGTPTDVYVVPPAAVAASVSAYEAASSRRVVGRPLRALTSGRLMARNYPADSVGSPGVADGIVPEQGPNYLLAKRIQRWRAMVDRSRGRTVSFHVAPAARTPSVTRNGRFAAAYAGVHRFGIEVFEPATAATLMAALLVHDLYANQPFAGVDPATPWALESHAAVHGGVWRSAYLPRSVIGLAAVKGIAARH